MSASEGQADRTSTHATSRPLGPGAVFAEKYQVARRLGAGGMADVYEVEHATTRRRLALKLLRPEVSGSRVNVERFYREASVCAGIDSDHIVQIIDCDVDKATSIPFLVMELLQGKDLATWVHESFDAGAPPPTALVLTVLKQVASALDKVHARGIVHRDLKPANLFLTFPSDGPPRVKILDFGVARLVTDTEHSAAGKVGTPLYMSAEQLRAGEVGPAADIWALALITYELFVGAPYWEGNTAATLFARIPDREAHPQPSTLAARHNVTLPRAFDLWLLRCIDPDPARRPVTAGAAVGDLLRIFDPKATQPPSSRPPDPASLPPGERLSARPVPPRSSMAPRAPRVGAQPRASVPAPQIPMPGAVKELDPDEIEDLTATADLSGLGPRKVVSRLRNVQGAPTTRMEPVKREAPTTRMEPVKREPPAALPRSESEIAPASLPPADEAVTGELPRARLHPHLTPIEDDAPPIVVPPSATAPVEAPAQVEEVEAEVDEVEEVEAQPEPEPKPATEGEVDDGTDTLTAKLSAVMEGSAPEARRRIPKAMELQATAILPAAKPAPEVRPKMLWLAAVGTLALVGTAAWALVHDRRPAPPPRVVDDGIWRAPSAAERMALGELVAAWSGALRERVSEGRGLGPARGEAPTGIDTAAGFAALIAGHRAGAVVPASEQVALLVALDRFRGPAGWTVPGENHAPRASGRATAWALTAYAAMTEVSRAPAALERVRVARAALLALRTPEGVTERAGAGAEVDVEATARAARALAAAERVDPATTEADREARRALVEVLRRWMDDPSHEASRDPRLHDLALRALWLSRDSGAGDEARARRWVDDVTARASGLGQGDAPAWVPRAALALGATLRAPGEALGEGERRRLSGALREALGALERGRGAAASGATVELAESTLAAAEVLR